MEDLFNLIEHTHRSIFLTGKAGTGKTTFLGNFVAKTKKKYVVVAPTGIAAINAGGVTIHSMFGLPLTTFVPAYDDIDRNEAINIQQLLPHFKYRRDKLKLLRALEILIIDEVSMLRCDVMDMIDLALRAARRPQQKFGGVQLLLIGDLYQLPPVVKENTERMLYTYYPSPFFFSAKALEGMQLLTIELKKVFRQTDAQFLQILNAIRDKDYDGIDFELLNSRYQPAFEPKESYVYLVSHNYMANTINQRNLDKLNETAYVFKAIISGDFREHLYPNDEALELKVGAQVMFIRNDSSEAKRYFNGKLAKVSYLDDETVKVIPDGENNELEIEREKWENKKYFVDSDKRIQEDVVGSYEQYPFRLAWAVTIHKSQGLTFDKVIIDAGKSFTSGQVYVALSRCRTLEGIILKSKITPSIIFTDERIASFHNETEASEKIVAILQDEKYNYAIEKLLLKTDVHWLKKEIADWAEAVKESRFLDDEAIEALAKELTSEAEEIVTVFEKFSKFVLSRMSSFVQTQQGWNIIEDKCKGAVNFFFEKMNEKFFVPLKGSYAETKGSKGLKGYNDVVKELIEEIAEYLSGLKTAALLDAPLYIKNTDDSISFKVEKKPSHIISFQMFEEGKSPTEIAVERQITEGTVLGHLAKMASVGVLDIKRLFSAETIMMFGNKFRQHNFESITQWKTVLPPEIDFNEIRVLFNHFKYQNTKTNISNER